LAHLDFQTIARYMAGRTTNERKVRLLTTGCVLLLLLTGCGAASATLTPPTYDADESVTYSDTRVLLRAAERAWHGTPYRYGGTTRTGIDCSAFVQTVYGDVFGIDLPRATAEQVHEGEKIDAGNLRPGDLVFFKTRPRTRHVGIYLGEGEFAHASTSQGVMISHLGDAYWRSRFWTSRRILPEAPEAMLPPRPPVVVDNTPPTRPPMRTGW
jgi:lipoprotein Spr/probable lipoprotein NlpC